MDAEQKENGISYNLNADGMPCEGTLCLSDGKLCCTEDGKTVLTVPLADVSEFILRKGLGCTAMEYRNADGKSRVLCRGTMEKHTNFAAEVDRLNRLLQKGSCAVFENSKGKAGRNACVCPKCGAHLAHPRAVCRKCNSKKSVITRFAKISMPYKTYLIGSFLLFMLSTGIGLLSPYISKILVDRYILAGHTVLQEILAGFLGVLFAMLVIRILDYIVTAVRNLTLMQAAVRISVRLRDEIFRKIHTLSLSQISDWTAGELIHRVGNDTMQVQQFIVNEIPNMLGQTLLLLAVGGIMIFYDWRLFLIMVLPMPIALVAMRTFHRKVHRIYGKQWQVGSKASTVLFDIFSGIRVVKSYGTEERESARYDEAAAAERDIAIRNEVFFARVAPFIRFSLTLGTYFLMYYTGKKILGSEMTIGEASMFTSYVSLIYGPIQWLTRIPTAIARAGTSLVRLFDILDEKPVVEDLGTAKPKRLEGYITFDHVSFGYEKGKDILKDISFDIKPGEMIGLVGRSGVGKSTLINLVMRMYDVSGGAIRIDGTDLRELSQESMRSQIGAVLQETFLFAGSVYENLLYAKPDATRDEIIRAAKIAGAHEFICKMPQGYNTRVGERGQTLSGGERQRVAIARALLRDPRILILDEATASLDTETEKQLQESLQRLTQNRTTIAIAHRLSTLRNATRIVVLDQGRVAEIGTHEELLAQKGIYHDLVMAQRSMSRMTPGKEAKKDATE